MKTVALNIYSEKMLNIVGCHVLTLDAGVKGNSCIDALGQPISVEFINTDVLT